MKNKINVKRKSEWLTSFPISMRLTGEEILTTHYYIYYHIIFLNQI